MAEELEDVGDRAQVEAKIKQAKRDAAVQRGAVKVALATPEVRKWIYSILLYGQIDENPYWPGRGINETLFACGELSVVKKIVADIVEADETLLTLMTIENKRDREQEKRGVKDG